MKKEYIKPTVNVVNVEPSNVIASSVEVNQCSCEQHDIWGGCNGCTGNCGCGGC